MAFMGRKPHMTALSDARNDAVLFFFGNRLGLDTVGLSPKSHVTIDVELAARRDVLWAIALRLAAVNRAAEPLAVPLWEVPKTE
jgi:hypothetical protein